MKKSELIIYWLTTVVISGFMLMSGYNLLTNPNLVEAINHLGYPDYFRIELGIAKVAGALVLLIPGLPLRMKGFAYAGFTIAFISAIISHVAVGDAAAASLKAGMFLVILAVSYVYLPVKVKPD